MKRPAVFIDRDGTINEEMGYINHISRFKIFDCSFEALRLLNENGFYAIVITNQSGAARGYSPVTFVDHLHEHMKELFRRKNCWVDDIFVCMHRKDSIIPELRIECNCRKPKTGLIEQALDKYDIDLENSFVIGDRLVDIEMGKKLNLMSILVKTGYGLGEIEFNLSSSNVKPDYIAQDILDAVKWILTKTHRPI